MSFQHKRQDRLHTGTKFWQLPVGSKSLIQSKQSKSKTWTRPQPESVSTPDPVATQSSTVSLQPKGSLETSLEPQACLAQRYPQNQSLRDSATTTVTNYADPETRRLIHKGRHKLVQPSSSGQASLHGVPPAQTRAFQQRSLTVTPSRKRATPSGTLPLHQPRKRRNTWVRIGSTGANSTSSVPVAVNRAAATPTLPRSTSLVRSTNSRKLQLVRKLSASPATSFTRHLSRNASLSRQLLSAKKVKNIRHPVLGVKSSGVAKLGKLQRIGGVLYKVGGSKLNRSLQRQLTPQTVGKTATPRQVRLVKSADSSSMLLKLLLLKQK